MLIKCPDCNKEISSKAKICPDCGYPILEENQKPINKNLIISPILEKLPEETIFFLYPQNNALVSDIRLVLLGKVYSMDHITSVKYIPPSIGLSYGTIGILQILFLVIGLIVIVGIFNCSVLYVIFLVIVTIISSCIPCSDFAHKKIKLSIIGEKDFIFHSIDHTFIDNIYESIKQAISRRDGGGA